MLRLLALAIAFLLPAAGTATAQTVEFPGGGGCIRGDMLIPMDWEGKLAFLVLIDGSSRTRFSELPAFLEFNWRPSTPPAPFAFRPVAGYFTDPRACAPGTPVVIRHIGSGASDLVQHDFGDLGPDGTLVSLVRGRGTFRAPASGNHDLQFHVQICNGASMCNLSRPPSSCYLPAFPTGLSAFVLVLE